MGSGLLKSLCISSVVFFLSACGSTSDNKVDKHSSNIQVSTATSKTKPTLNFEKKDVGVNAVNAAISDSNKKNATPISAKISSNAVKLVNSTIELVRYSFGKNNSIYIADFKDALMFDHDKAAVRRKDKSLINNFSNLYTKGTFGKYLYIIGHTDTDGSASYNYGLSTRRARSVADILLANNFPESKLSIVPAGEYLPKATNNTKKGKQLNRRVEVISADSRALIQSYIRQLECPPAEKCGRKLLNVFDVRKVGKSAELSLNSAQSVAIFSPELNNLIKLDNALRSGSSREEAKLLNNNDKRELLKMGNTRQAFTIPLDMRPVLRLSVDKRKGFVIPKQYIIKD
jgi:outer membrane protein OmpA-like peptidoglycan-associated protein